MIGDAGPAAARRVRRHGHPDPGRPARASPASSITVTRGDGVRANYFHVNDDTPGHDRRRRRARPADPSWPRRRHDGQGRPDHRLHGRHRQRRRAARTSTSRSARPKGIPIDPYPAVLAAQQREQCSVGIGPWSTDFISPDEQQLVRRPSSQRCHRSEQDIIKWVAGLTPPPLVHTILVGPDGARWEIDEGGTRRATGGGRADPAGFRMRA